MGLDNKKGVLFAAFTALLWGFLAIALKVAVSGLSPVSVVWFRFTTAFLLLIIWTLIFRRNDFLIFMNPPVQLFLAALFLGFNYLGFISGINYVSPSTSQVFIQIGPVTFALSGILIFREKVNWKHVVGFILVVTGIIVFYSEELSELAGMERDFTRGMLFILGGGLSWATFATFQKKLVQRYSTNQLNLFIYGFCAILFAPFVQYGKLPGLNAGSWLLLTFLGLNTVLAYGSLAVAIKYTEATRVSVIITVNPVITFIAMALLKSLNVSWIEEESFGLMSVLGALTVLSGAVLVISAGWKNNNENPRRMNRGFS